jgi:hypothetical protein
VALLTGLIDASDRLPKVASAYGGIPGAAGNMAVVGNPDIKPSAFSQGDNVKSLNELGPLEVSATGGTKPITQAPKPITPFGKGASFLAKRAMSEQDLMTYYGSGGDVLGFEGNSASKIDPKTMGIVGLGGSAAVGANRLRTKNMAKRELAGIRKAYTEMIQSGQVNKDLLRNLNKELATRGAPKGLKAVATTGLADALMSKSEQGLAKRLSRQRYRGALPLVALSVLGAAAYNKMND